MRPVHHVRALVCASLVAFGVAGCDALQEEPPVPIDLALDGVDVVETQSGDLLVQSGEYVEVDAFLTNRSPLPVDSVGFRVESDGFDLEPGEISAYVNGEVVYDEGDFDDHATLGAGATVRIHVVLRVPPNTPPGTVGTLEFGLTGRGNRSGRVTGQVTTAALPYDPVVVGTTVVADTDGDGRVEPGESAEIEVGVGLVGTPSGGVCFFYGVTSTLSQITIVGIPGNEYGCARADEPSRPQFGFRAASIVPSGTTVPFSISARDRYGNTWALPFTVTLG